MKKGIYLDVPPLATLDFAAIAQAVQIIALNEVALADGFVIAVDWGSVEGMNDVRVDNAVLSITRATDVEPVAREWTLSAVSVDGQPAFDVTVDAPRVHALVLEGLMSGGNELNSEADLRARGLRLVVSLPGQMPLFTAPAVEAKGVLPASFTGARYAGGVLTLPDLAAGKVRLSLVKTGFPGDSAPQPMTLAKVSGVGATVTTDLVLTESTGEVVWRIDGEMPVASTTADLRLFIEKTLKAKAKTRQPLKTSFTLTGKGKAFVSPAAPTGTVIRRVPGILTTELAGEAIPLAVPPPYAAELPSRAITGVTIRYHEIRLLEQFVDAVPAKAGGIAGIVVGDAPVLRKLPPRALDGLEVAKIALVGRPPVDCELVVQLVHADSGAVVTQPAAATLAASASTSLVWLDVPAHPPIEVPVAVAARTNHGRFLWAASPEPLLRIAIHDPDPGDLPVFIGGSDARQKTLAGAQFASRPPLVESLLFATVDVADLALEYDR